MSTQPKKSYAAALEKVDSEVELLKHHQKVIYKHIQQREKKELEELNTIRKQREIESLENVKEHNKSVRIFTLSLIIIAILYAVSLPRKELAAIIEFLVLRFPIFGLFFMYWTLKKAGK